MNIEELKGQMLAVADSFYQLDNKTGLQQWPTVFGSWKELALRSDGEMQARHLQVLKNAMEALELKEYILLADILCFEAVELIEG